MAGQSTIVTMERAKEIPSHCDFHVEWVIADPCTTTRHSCGSNGNQKKNNCGESSSSVLVREYYKINRPPGHGIVSQKSVHAITVIKSNATSLRWRSLFIYISCPVPSALAWIEIEGDRAVPSLLCISSSSTVLEIPPRRPQAINYFNGRDINHPVQRRLCHLHCSIHSNWFLTFMSIILELLLTRFAIPGQPVSRSGDG